MGRIYKNPPVIEALCEIRFKSEHWDWTIPGLLYREIGDRFPKKRQQNILDMQFELEKSDISQHIKGGVLRVQFLREDESALVQVGPDILVVNQLRPYPHWPVFKELIFEMLSTYKKVANPSGIVRVVLRYINRIEIGTPTFSFAQYFQFSPTLPDPVPKDIRALLMRTEIPFQENDGLLILTIGSERSDVSTFVLDLEFITTAAETLTFEMAGDWVEGAHSQIEMVFEASITDETRALFEEVSV